MPHAPMAPIEALRTVAENCHGEDVERAPVARPTGGYLAEPLELPVTPRGDLVSTRNGYALPAAGLELEASGPSSFTWRCPRVSAAGADVLGDFPGTETPRGAEERLPVALRVETGDEVPGEFDRVLPIDRATVTGTERIEVAPEDLPDAGAGIVHAGESLALPVGTPLTPRVRALLLSRGISEVAVRPARPTGFAAIGSELVDVLALDAPETVAGDAGAATGELTGWWLGAALRDLGPEPRSLGLVGDEPRAIVDLLLRAERHRIGTLILTGGLGDGISDRTLEAIRSSAFRIFFDGIALATEFGERVRLLFAQGLGMDLFVLSGRPLEAAIGFDAFVAPGLLGARGAAPSVWDWSRTRLADDETTGPDAAGETWTVRALGADISPAGATWLPVLPGQSGWEIRSPASAPPARRYRVPARA